MGTLKVDAHVKNTCLIHNMRSNSILNELYGRAKDGDGSVTKRYSPTGGGDIGGDNDAIVLARVGEIPDGERMILVNSEIVPVAGDDEHAADTASVDNGHTARGGGASVRADIEIPCAPRFQNKR